MHRILSALTIPCPVLSDIFINKKLLKSIDESPENNPAKEDIKNSPVSFYREKYEDSIRAKDRFEDKAKTNIVGITISVTLIMGSSSFLTNLSNRFIIILFITSVIYMLSAGFLAVKVLFNYNVIYTTNSFIQNRQEYKKTLYSLTKKNVKMNIIRNNALYSSYNCIRNALVCLFAVFVLVLLPIQDRNQLDKAVAYNSPYTFYFSEETLKTLEEPDTQDIIKTDILKFLNDTEQKNVSKMAIIDHKKSFFIQFDVDGSRIQVNAIESYNN